MTTLPILFYFLTYCGKSMLCQIFKKCLRKCPPLQFSSKKNCPFPWYRNPRTLWAYRPNSFSFSRRILLSVTDVLAIWNLWVDRNTNKSLQSKHSIFIFNSLTTLNRFYSINYSRVIQTDILLTILFNQVSKTRQRNNSKS